MYTGDECIEYTCIVGSADVSLPLQICTKPMTMMSASASSFPAVKMSCTLVAHLTLEQFTHVSSTEQTNTHAETLRIDLCDTPYFYILLLDLVTKQIFFAQINTQIFAFWFTSWRYLLCPTITLQRKIWLY